MTLPVESIILRFTCFLLRIRAFTALTKRVRLNF